MQETVCTLSIENISFHQEFVSHPMSDYFDELSSLVKKLHQIISQQLTTVDPVSYI